MMSFIILLNYIINRGTFNINLINFYIKINKIIKYSEQVLSEFLFPPLFQDQVLLEFVVLKTNV